MLKKEKKFAFRFSVIELMVVIAIMAVLTAVLAPAMLRYVESSRTQGDTETMEKVVHVVEIAMTNETIYNEVIVHGIEEEGSDDEAVRVTITFMPKDGCYIPPESVVNRGDEDETQLRHLAQLNNYLQQNIGDKIELKSDAYRNSEYTVFIKMGETKNDVEVWGEFEK